MAALLLVLVLGAVPSVHAAQNPAAGRPRIGLVLGGGGARGAAHIGVLRVLQQLHVPIDCIVGTSMGAIIGGLYAAGMGPGEMQKAITSIDWPAVFSDSAPRSLRAYRIKRDDNLFLVQSKPGLKNGKIALPKGAIQGQKLTVILTDLSLRAAGIRDFDKLRVPFRAVATDIGTGDPVVLSHGDLAMAMRASMSIPSVFAPVQLDGKVLVDGFLSDNLPIDVARKLCADRVIAVDIATPLQPGDKLGSFIGILGQLAGIMTQQNTRRQKATLRSTDVLIHPELGDMSVMAFDQADKAIAIGEKAAWAMRAKLEKLALSPAAYQQQVASHPAPNGSEHPVIDFIRIENNSRLSNQVIRSRLHIRVGQRLDRAQLSKDLLTIHGLGNFERVEYRLVKEHGETGLVVTAVEKSWGPDYLQFGLNLQANGNGDTAFNVAAGYLKTEVNSLGGEWRNYVELGENIGLTSDFYQPLDPDYRFFVEPIAAYRQFDAGYVTSEAGTRTPYRVKRTDLSISGGMNVGSCCELRFGLNGGFGSTSLKNDGSSPLTGSFTDVGYLAQFSADTLDNVNFPHTGYFARLRYVRSLKALGSDQNFSYANLELVKPFAFGDDTLLPILELNGRLSGDLPLQDQFLLGGFLHLSGYRARALSGQYSALARIVYLHRLDQASAILEVPIYAGGSLETGNVWNSSDDISFDSLQAAGSVFFGADTPIGPFYLGGGVAQGGNKSFYMYLGRTF